VADESDFWRLKRQQWWKDGLVRDRTYREQSGEPPVRVTHACTACGGHIDGDEAKRRTREGWFPYHPLCAPDKDAVTKIGIRIRGGC